MDRFFIILTFICISFLPVEAQVTSGAFQALPSNLALTSDTGRISWGERAEIKLRLGMGVGGNVVWPMWEDTIPGGLEILAVSKLDTLAPGELDPLEWDMVLEQKWEVTGWDSGFVNIPAVRIGEEVSQPLMLQIVPTRGAELKPASGIIEINYTFIEKLRLALPWVMLVLGGLLVALLTYLGYKKWTSREMSYGEVKSEIPLIPPHITALEELRKLKERETWARGEAKTFHVKLSLIIRTYIDARFMVSSLDKTTREALEIIKYLDISEGDKNNLFITLRLGDKVKFAKHRAEAHEHSKSVTACLEFVENTILRDENLKEEKYAKDEVAK